MMNALLVNVLLEFTLASPQWATTYIYFGPARHSIESKRSARGHQWPRSGLLGQPGTCIRTERCYCLSGIVISLLVPIPTVHVEPDRSIA